MNVYFAPLARLLRWLSPYRKAQQEMADQRWAKQAKIDSLDQTISVRDIKELGDSDRDAVEAFRNSKLKKMNPNFEPVSKSSGDRDTWVCDDMTINTGRSSLPEVLAVLGAALLAFWYFTKDSPVVADAPIDDSAYSVLFYDKDGKPISVQHISQLQKQE